MKGNAHADLCERIRLHCQQRSWYGPDGMRDFQSRDERCIQGFAFGPATPEQLHQTEQRIGFTLPSVLQAVYLQVANGGFGPGYGLAGVLGGFHIDSAGPVLHSTLAGTLTRSTWRLSEGAIRAIQDHPYRYLECGDDLPDGLLTLCHWGCGIFSVLYRWSSCVYLTYGIEAAQPDPQGDIHIVLALEYQAASVEDWLERWIRDELDQEGAAGESEQRRLSDELELSESNSWFDEPEDWAWYQRARPFDSD